MSVRDEDYNNRVVTTRVRKGGGQGARPSARGGEYAAPAQRFESNSAPVALLDEVLRELGERSSKAYFINARNRNRLIDFAKRIKAQLGYTNHGTNELANSTASAFGVRASNPLGSHVQLASLFIEDQFGESLKADQRARLLQAREVAMGEEVEAWQR